MPRLVQDFVERWAIYFSGYDAAVAVDAQSVDILVRELLSEASFRGISRSQIEAEFGDIPVMIREILLPRTH